MQRRMLFLTARAPYPLNDGWKIRTYNLIKGAALAGYSVDLLSFVGGEEERALLRDGLSGVCDGVYSIMREKSYAMSDLVRGALTATPFPVLNYSVHGMRRKVAELATANRYGVIQAEDIVMGQYALEAGSRIKILDMHNVESELMRRYSAVESSPAKRAYASITARKLSSYEDNVAGSFDAALVCSENDREILARRGAYKRVEVVPNGVDCSHYAGWAMRPVEPSTLVFVGRMDYHANVSGMTYFVDKVFGLIKKTSPGARLIIVGSGPSPEVMALRGDDVTVTGSVKDVREYLAKAAVVVVPLLVGGGTRLKILEAMAMGKAIVSTSLGCEGIDASDGGNILIADAPEEFARKVSLCLNDAGLRRRIGASAMEFVKSRYDWGIVLKKMAGVYEELAARKACGL